MKIVVRWRLVVAPSGLRSVLFDEIVNGISMGVRSIDEQFWEEHKQKKWPGDSATFECADNA